MSALHTAITNLGWSIAVVGGILIGLLIIAPPWFAVQAHRDDLTAAQAASTLFRFFKSSHVRDLRSIFWMVYALFIFVVFAFLYIGLESAFSIPNNAPDAVADMIRTAAVAKESSDPIRRFLDSVSIFPPIALGLGAIISWAYRTASSRLGVVDLFACEIDSLCRVGTIVDIAQRFVDSFGGAVPGSNRPTDNRNTGGNLEAKEEYFPIFNNNAKDLQVLEAGVVTNITAFYTYMKAFRDSRRLLQTKSQDGSVATYREALNNSSPGNAKSGNNSFPLDWGREIFNTIYMLFLAYESARKATEDLVEYEPTASECIVTIMITELKCYAFLLKYCGANFSEDDIRAQRLDLRRSDYVMEASWINALVNKHKMESVWQPAVRLLAELRKQFKMALQEDLEKAPLRAPSGCGGHGLGLRVE